MKSWFPSALCADVNALSVNISKSANMGTLAYQSSMYLFASPSNWSIVNLALFRKLCFSKKVTWFQIYIYICSHYNHARDIRNIAFTLFTKLLTQLNNSVKQQQYCCIPSSTYRNVETTCMHVPVRWYTGWVFHYYMPDPIYFLDLSCYSVRKQCERDSNLPPIPTTREVTSKST